MFISSHYTIEMPCEISEIGAEAFEHYNNTVDILVLPKGSEAPWGLNPRGPVTVQVYRSTGFGADRRTGIYSFNDEITSWHVEVNVDAATAAEGWKHDQEKSDERNENIAHAILGAIELAKHLRQFTEQFEQSFVEARTERRRIEDEYEAAKQAKIDADPAIGEVKAELLLKRARKAAKIGNWASIKLPLFHRGDDEERGAIRVGREYGGPVCLRFARSRTNQQRAVEMIAESSFRSVKGILRAIREHERTAEPAS